MPFLAYNTHLEGHHHGYKETLLTSFALVVAWPHRLCDVLRYMFYPTDGAVNHLHLREVRVAKPARWVGVVFPVLWKGPHGLRKGLLLYSQSRLIHRSLVFSISWKYSGNAIWQIFLNFNPLEKHVNVLYGYQGSLSNLTKWKRGEWNWSEVKRNSMLTGPLQEGKCNDNCVCKSKSM